MGDHNRAARPLLEGAFQPLDTIKVKVVSGLVKQEQAGFIRHGTDERYAFAHTARQRTHNGFGRQPKLVNQGAYA